MDGPYFSCEITARCILFPQEPTVWQMYLRQCIEIVAKSAELFPMDTYDLVVSLMFTLNWQVQAKDSSYKERHVLANIRAGPHTQFLTFPRLEVKDVKAGIMYHAL
jgi:hypothetical protein